MGNSVQKYLGGKGRKLNESESKKNGAKGADGKLPPSDILTDEEIDQLQATWPHIRPHINKILTQAFLDLFAENPDIKDKFMGFRNLTIEDLKKVDKGSDNALQHHIPRVGRALVKIANHVANLDAVIDYIQCVGKIHHKNGIMYHEMVALGPFFVQALKKYLPSKYRGKPEIADSWMRFYVVITDLLRRGYPEFEDELSEDEKIIIRETFRLIRENMSDVGVSVFVGLFKAHSTSKMFFPIFKDSPLEDLTLSEALQNHGLKLMKVIETVVMELDNPPRQTDIFLARLGMMHQSMGIEKKYLDVMGPIFVHSIRSTLQEEGYWGMEVRHAWLHLFRIIVLKIKKGYKDLPESFSGHNAVDGTRIRADTLEEDDSGGSGDS